jgi:hypothetical protein
VETEVAGSRCNKDLLKKLRDFLKKISGILCVWSQNGYHHP